MIRIKNWSSYQSYKDRMPPWIRLHRSLLDNFEFQSLSDKSRALLPMLWLLACEDKDPTSGLIPHTVDKISFRLRQSKADISASLIELQDSDFIECIESVTESLLICSQNVTPETETETETETEKRQKKHSTAFALPDWIDADDWNLWIKTRKGKKMLPEQMQAQVEKLRKWKEEGLPYWEALRDSASNGWQGLFEPKVKFKNSQDSRLDVVNQIMGGRNGANRPIRDITPQCSDQGDRARIPEVIDGVWESDGV